MQTTPDTPETDAEWEAHGYIPCTCHNRKAFHVISRAAFVSVACPTCGRIHQLSRPRRDPHARARRIRQNDRQGRLWLDN